MIRPRLSSLAPSLPIPLAARRHQPPRLVGDSRAIRALRAAITKAAASGLPVLIQGETGTGKDLIARAVHAESARAARPFVAENAAAIPDSLAESILFGHRRGAFTGALADRAGLLEQANSGTLFLDEIAELSLPVQGKLLRALQQQEFRPVGSETTRQVDFRLVAATNVELEAAVAAGRFRADLFYRLNVVTLVAPPLRSRPEDLPSLVAHLLEKHDAAGARSLDDEAFDSLQRYDWPGNVRQLENELQRALAYTADPVIRGGDLSPTISGRSAVPPSPAAALPPADGTLSQQVERLERITITAALASVRGNRTHAAKRLGLSRYGLQKKLRRYQLASSFADSD